MISKFNRHATSLCSLLLLFLVPNATESTSVPTILVFGDSTVDPGNNNYIKNTPLKCNFPPYGIDFVNQTATGRFTDGKLVTDIVAKYVGIKEYVPPYLDPNLSIDELITGVSFASGGTGFDPLTPKISNVIPLSKQLEYFKEYQRKLEAKIGKGKTRELINNTLYIVSAGTNDFVISYFALPIRRKQYTISSYIMFVLQEACKVYQELLDQGARRIGVVGLPPFGCLPIVITGFSDKSNTNRNCIDRYSLVARQYNQMLRNELNALQLRSPCSNIAYLDIYGPVDDLILGHKYDFDVVNKGCCGTGLIEFGLLCNPTSTVCSNVNKHVFWDASHPSQKAYELIFQSIRPVVDALVEN